MDSDLVFTLESLNRLGEEDFAGLMYDCCSSAEWAARMTENRPFADKRDFLNSAKILWKGLNLKDQREALAGEESQAATNSMSQSNEATFEDALKHELDKKFQRVLSHLNEICADEPSA